MRHSLHPLLPQYQQQLHLALEPLQRHAGKISLEDFQQAIKSFKELLPFFTWLDSEAAKAAYVLFNQACTHRQSDILTQIQALSTLSKPNDTQAKEYQEWQTIIAKLLYQWERDGYQIILENWQTASHQQIPALSLLPVSSLQDEVLNLLAQGLATLTPETQQEQSLPIPTAWKQAQKTALDGLRRYATQQQLSAFQQLKRRYRVRLWSYQKFCEELSHTHYNYANLADWCKVQINALDALTPQLCADNQQPPIVWPWQSWRQSQSTFTPISWLKQICEHLEKLLPPAPCCFEVLGMQSSTQPNSWRIHVLIDNQNYCQRPYFTAWRELLQLYHTLLPTSCLSLAPVGKMLPAISITTPQALAHYYCPLWQFSEETTPALIYLPVFHQQHTGTKTASNQSSFSLLTAYITHLSLRLSEVEAQGQEEQKAIRIRHHALATQTLIATTEEEAKQNGDPDLLDVDKMLLKRLHAQREIQHLWQTQHIQYAPLVDMLAYVTIKHPQVIEAFLQTAKKKDSVTLSESKEHKTKTPEISNLKTTIPELQVYRRLPRILKSRFIQQLKVYSQTNTVPTESKTAEQKTVTQSPDQKQTSSIPDNITQLCQDTDVDGWCYRQQQIEMGWQQTLQALWSAPPTPISAPEELKTDVLFVTETLPESKSAYPPVKLRFVRDGQMVEGLLHPAVVKQLLDDQKPTQGKWRSKAKNISGRHLVLRVVLPKSEDQPQKVVWFKINPEQPGTEYLVQKIDQFLGGFATPPQQLTRITIGDQPGIPVLISEEVAPPVVDPKTSMNLAHVLMYRPEYL